MDNIKINTEFIKLDQFLKWCGFSATGSNAKLTIENGSVKVNGNIEYRRGRKLFKGDLIEIDEKAYRVL